MCSVVNVLKVMPFGYIGGNSLDKAPASPVTDFVKSHGGHTVITKVSTLFYSGLQIGPASIRTLVLHGRGSGITEW